MPRGKRTISPRRYNPRASAESVKLPGESALPPLSVSLGTMMAHHTGSWRAMRPAFRDRTPPCLTRCPAGENIERYLLLLGEGRAKEAAQVLKDDNPLPATCGRVCYHPCEGGCNQTEHGGAVAIHAIERYLGDLALDFPIRGRKSRTRGKKRSGPRGKRVAVVGSGPAGLACAWHLAHLGLRPTIFEADEKPGGVLRTGIPSYRLPKDVLDREIAQVLGAGVELECATRIGEALAFEELAEVYAAVFVAAGYHKPRTLDVPGEELAGVEPGLAFLARVNRGDRARPGLRVAVIGGGNTAIDCARTSLRLGAEVTVVYRRTRDEMPAVPEEVAEAEREGVSFEFLASPVAFEADAGGRAGADGRVRRVRVQRMRLGESDGSGRRRPVPIPGAFDAIECDAALLATGEIADLSFLPRHWEATEAGLAIDRHTGAPVEGVFLGGDLTTPVKMVAHAVGSGKHAARLLARHLAGTPWATAVAELGTAPASFALERHLAETGRERSPEIVDAAEINIVHFRSTRRNEPGRIDRIAARSSFEEVNLGYDEGAAVREARRCFHCGVCTDCDNCFVFCPDGVIRRKRGGGYEIDYTYCKGCGVCAEECPRGAIAMEREER